MKKIIMEKLSIESDSWAFNYMADAGTILKPYSTVAKLIDFMWPIVVLVGNKLKSM